jgi:tetratricopeptide (TPR) repeat protein
MEIISFFSFKGGVGRTALVTNLGSHWAMAGKTVVLVDMDLAAPGLTFLPMAGEWIAENGRGLGISDVLAAYHFGLESGDISLLPPSLLLRRMNDPTKSSPADLDWDDKGRLLLIDSGSPRQSRPTGASSDGVPGTIPPREGGTDSSPGTQALRQLAEAIRQDLADWRDPKTEKGIDYVLIDCRTGFAELVDLSLGFLADRMVLVSGLNAQNLTGLELTLKALQDQNRVTLDAFPAKVTVVFSPVPVTEEESSLSALEKAHVAINSAMRVTTSGIREMTPNVFHLHYAPALAVDDQPLLLRQPRSRYAKEVRLIANWLDGIPSARWEYAAVEDDTINQITKQFDLCRGEVSLTREGPPPGTKADEAAKRRPNPLADLPAWHWALAQEQQTPVIHRSRLRDLVKVRAGVTLDAEAFATTLAWAVPLPASERQRMLDDLPRMKQERVTETYAQLQDLRRQALGLADRNPTEAMRVAYRGAREWASMLNRKPVTGLRRFLCDPVDGIVVFPAWQEWPDYWLWLARDLFLVLGDSTRAIKAIDRAAEMGEAEDIAARLPHLIPPDRIDPKVRAALLAKARALAPDSPLVEFQIVSAEHPLDRPAARVAVLPLLQTPPSDSKWCESVFQFVADNLPALLGQADLILECATRDEPQSSRSHTHRGRFHIGKCNYTDAETALLKAIELDPRNASAWQFLGSVLQRDANRLDEAEKAFLQAVNFSGSTPRPHTSLGVFLSDIPGRQQEAENCFRRAIQIDGKLIKAWIGLGNLLSEQTLRHDEAECAFRQVTDLDTKSSMSWLAFGNFLFSVRHKYEEADNALLRATENDSQDDLPWINRGIILANFYHRYGDAEFAYRKAIDIDSENASAWNGLGRIAELSKQCRSALLYYGEAQKFEEFPRGGTAGASDLQWRLGKWEAARAVAKTALTKLRSAPPGQWNVFFRLSFALLLNDSEQRDQSFSLFMEWSSIIGWKVDFKRLSMMCKIADEDASDDDISDIMNNLSSNVQRLDVLDSLYTLAGWRPECRERARPVARRFIQLAPEVTARFRDVPTPPEQLEIFVRFANGLSDGAGDPRDLPFICDDAAEACGCEASA